MRLRAFRVRMFRTIVDSGVAPVFPTTVLVGREEAGKTSLLHALALLHPAEPFDVSLEDDWPRERRSQRTSRQVEWPETLVVGRSYDGRFVLSADRAALEERVLSADPSSEPDTEAVEALLARRLPAFVHLDPEGLLEGDVEVRELCTRLERAARPADRTLVALLGLAGIEPAELLEPGAGARVQGANRTLIAVLADGGANPGGALGLDLALVRGRLSVRLELLEGGLVRVDRAPEHEAWRAALGVRMRAAGAGTRAGTVILLDGPGRSFRKVGVERMREVMATFHAEGGTLVYSARLPFRTELQHDEQVLVLAPEDDGSIVTAEFARGGPGESEVRAALGMTGRSSFRVAAVNLVVEGPQDGALLEALSELFERSGEEGLPADVNVARAGGAHEVASVAAFLARQGLCSIALFDSDDAGRAGRAALDRRLAEERDGRHVVALMLGEAAGLDAPDAAIEELFPANLYLGAVRDVLGEEAPADLLAGDGPPGEGSLASRLRTALVERGVHFPKSEVTAALCTRIEEAGSVAELSPHLADAARRLFAAVRRAARALACPPGRSGERD
jgi:hypothetical protein